MPARPCSITTVKAAPITWSDARGNGIVAVDDVEAGEVVAVFGGEIFDASAFSSLPREKARLGLQVDNDYFLVSQVEGPGDWVNHSCDPNLGLRGQIVLVALRSISLGEELCFDYAMSDGDAHESFDCGCGTLQCRKKISGDDWRCPTLWSRYEGYFSPYLARRIARLQITNMDGEWSPYPVRTS